MDNLISNLTNYFFEVRMVLGNYLEPALPWLKFISVIISGLFLWGIIYIMSAGGYIDYKAEKWSDMLGFGDVGRKRQLRSWKRILQNLKSRAMSDWKSAIIKADMIFDEILKMSGYRGDSVHDRFKQLSPTAISNYDKISAAHKIRDRIIQEPDFSITRDETVEVLKIYEQAFKELGLLE